MHGFKSFADPVIIDFHEGITCIVGPNGSGKSNISDAIRWVLGEQSPKALRGGKMEEVIFAGTASRKSRGMAEVVLVIDNSTGLLDIDYSEVAITRRMYRSGESEYLINNNPCRLRDIRELIMDTGIGVDGYSIIGQGKISEIVSNKPESRREIFEEVAGVVMYKNRRHDAEKKLESTSINLERVSDIIAEIEGRIGPLREESIKAAELIELNKKYEDLEINVILHNIDSITESNKAFAGELQDLENAINSHAKEHGEIFAESSKLSDRREVIDRIIGETRDKIMAAIQSVNELTSRNEVSRERLSGIESEKKLIEDDLISLNDKLEVEQASFEAICEEKASLERDIEKAKQEMNLRIAEYNEAASIQAGIAAGVDEARSLLFDSHKELSSCESEIKGIDSLKESLIKRRAELTALSSGSDNNSKEYEAMLSSVREELTSAENNASSLREMMISVKDKIISSEKISQSLIEEIERTKLEKTRILSRLRTIEELESNYEGYNFGVKAVMKANISGIRGVAADLMNVPRGYETAIETAMGAALQNIICSSDIDAKRGVEYLKQNKAGRVTFLPVSSIKNQKSYSNKEIEKDPGFIDYAVNIINFDKEYENIYSYLLSRVAVVKSMDAAITLSKSGSGLRFVTLEGEIINASGAITGGAFRHKTANILDRKAEINELSDKINKLDGEISAMQKKLDSNKNETFDLRRSFEGLENDLRSSEIKGGTLKSSVAAAEERLLRESEASERIKSELNDIEVQLKGSDDLTLSHRTKAAAVNQAISDVTKQLDELIDSLESAKHRTEEKSESVTAARISLNEIAAKSDAHIRMSEKVQDTLSAYKAQIKSKEEMIGALIAERENITASFSDGSEIEVLVSERENLESVLSKLTHERDDVVAKQRALESEQSGAAEKINDLRDRKYQIEIKAAKGDTQLEALKEKLWEEFEISYAQAADRRREDFVYSRAVKETRTIRNRIREIGPVSISSIDEYEQTSERYKFLTEQKDDIVKAKDELIGIIDEMDRTIKKRFKENFDEVVKNFEVIFKELFGGGYSELRMEDDSDPLNSGIEIIAQPPGKKLQNINLMSGGEKTMTAIALMFAVLKTKPTPFCILDEVEAALDDNNIDRFAEYLRKFNEIQFALVTHQKATMEHADVLYGVTMPEHGISKVLSLRMGDEFEL